MQTADAAWQGLEPLRQPLVLFLARHCRDTSELDDVVQETFVRAARFRGDVRDERAITAWAMKIAFHVLADRRRRERRSAASSLPGSCCEDLGDLPAQSEEEGGEFVVGSWLVDRDAALALLERALERLPPADRRILEAYYGDGGRRAAARRCRIPAALVKVRLYRARGRLVAAMRVLLAERVLAGRPPRRAPDWPAPDDTASLGAARRARTKTPLGAAP
jgi:RNA polymerase sigma-70 factor (ECF subfamily)